MRSLILVVLAATACDVDVEPCPPCHATIAASATITLTSEQLNKATATICRNEADCASGTLEVNFGNPVGMLGGTGGVQVEIGVQGTAQVITFVMAGGGGLFGATADGDVYHATITGSDGTVLLDVSGTAQYTDTAAKGCFTLDACESASITMM